MAAPANHEKLGFFVLMCIGVIAGSAFFFLQKERTRPVLELVSYTEQTVTGLDVRSPVRFRGVKVGEVDQLSIVSGTGVVRIGFVLFLDKVVSLGGNEETVKAQLTDDAIAYRSYVMTNPLTGEAHLLVSTPKRPSEPLPPPEKPDRIFVPSTSSPLGKVADRLPELVNRGFSAVDTLEILVHRLPGTMDKADRFFDTANSVLGEADLEGVGDDTRSLLSGVASDFNQMSESISGEVERAKLDETTESLRKSMDRTAVATEELRREVPRMRAALEEMGAATRKLESRVDQFARSGGSKK